MGCKLSGVSTEGEQTREQVLLALAAAGFEVTGDQLGRWHRAGLLPRPRQRSLGRGMGTVTVYPPGTAEQAMALCRIRTHHRSLRRAAFQLWWDGFAVDPAQVKEPIRLAAAKLDADMAVIASGEGTIPIRFGGPADRRLGRRGRERLAATLRTASKDLAAPVPPFSELVLPSMPPSIDELLDLAIPLLLRALAGIKAVELVDQTSFEDLGTARDQTKFILDAITRWVQPMAWLWGKKGTIFQLVADIQKSVQPEDLPVLLLTFLIVRQMVPPEIWVLVTAPPPEGLREIAALKAVHDRVPGAEKVITPMAVRALLRHNEAARRHRHKIDTFVQEHVAEVRSVILSPPRQDSISPSPNHHLTPDLR